MRKLMKYIYSGPASGVTLSPTVRKLYRGPIAKYPLPEDNEWVITMIARRHQGASGYAQEVETNEEEIVHGS